jgi:hypothetical protein
MCFDTTFTGRFALSCSLTAKESAILKAVHNYRPQDGLVLPSAAPGQERPVKIVREGVELNYGGEGFHIFKEFPSFDCRWTISSDKRALVRDGRGPFRNYVSWLEYLISHFFAVWGVQLSGTVTLRGGRLAEKGSITVDGDGQDGSDRGIPHRGIVRLTVDVGCVGMERGWLARCRGLEEGPGSCKIAILRVRI